MFIGTKTPLNKVGDAPLNTWTSNGFNVDRADRIAGIVMTDQAGTLSIQQSGDGGANWDWSEDVSVTANTGASFSKELYGSTVRLKFVNTASTNQTFIRIEARATSAGDS